MKKHRLILPLAVLLVGSFQGCTTPVAIDPVSGEEQTAEFRAGTFYAPIDGNADSVFRVAIREMDAMGYFRTGELHKEDSIAIFARKVGDEKVTVRIKQVESGLSELRIRVGRFGNLPESQKIYSRIRDAS